MKKSSIANIILSLMLVGAGFFIYKLLTVKATYKKEVAANEMLIAQLRGNVDSINGTLNKILEYSEKLQQALDVEMASRRKDREEAKVEREKLHSKITVLETELQPLIDSNPKLQELIATYKSAAAADATQINALDDECTIWYQKYNLAVVDRDAALLAKANMQAALEKSLTGFTQANKDLDQAGKTIARQRAVISFLGIGGGTVVAVVTTLILTGVIHK